MRNKIKKFLTICLAMVTLATLANPPILAEASVDETLTGTQADIQLNREVTIDWEKNGDKIQYYFTPTEKKQYVFTVTDYKDGKIADVCSICGHVGKTQVISHPKKLGLNKSKFVYDGKTKTPSVVVTGANGKAISSSNYTVSYAKGRINAGTYNVKVTFKGNYTGTMTTKFEVTKASQKLKITAPKKTMKVGSKAKIKISTNKNHGKVSYKVSNSKIATVKNGTIKAMKKGTVKLTVTLKETKNYKKKSTTFTIKVK